MLHIGRQKTGTTSVQSMLLDNQSLLSAHGVWYASTGRDGEKAHHALARLLNPAQSHGSELREVKLAFDREVESRPEELIVVSSEGFQNIEDHSRVREFFSGYRLIVVCYLRECLAWKQSAYAQLVHAQRYWGQFVPYALGFDLDYAGFCEAWESVADDFHPVLFERRRLLGNDVVSDFLHRIGADLEPDVLQRLTRFRENPSLGGNLLYFKLLVNMAHENHRSFRHHYGVLARLAAEEPRWREKWFVSDVDARRIRRVDRDSNRYLERRFGEVRMVDTTAYPAMPDQDTLSTDISRILSTSELQDALRPLGLGPSR